MPVIKGKDFMFSAVINGNREILCHATDFTINTNLESIETSGPNNGAWRSFVPGMLSYSVTVPALVSYTDPFNWVQLQQLQFERKTFELFSGTDISGGYQMHGFIFITTLQLTSQMRDSVKFDMTAQGTGPVEGLFNPVVRNVYLGNTRGIRLPGCPNPYPIGVLWYDGTFIGLANSPDDVIAVFNEYSATQGGYLQLTAYSGGCDFVMEIAWNSPLNPTFIPATTGNGFVIGGRFPGDVIGESDNNNNVIGG